MISFQQIFSKDALFYDLLEESAEEARQSVEALTRMLSLNEKTPSLKEFHASKEADKKITERIAEEVAKSFVTELDREDIEILSTVLYKIPKTVEKFAERYLICASHANGTDFSRHITLLVKATEQIVAMVRKLRKRTTVEDIKAMNSVLQQAESDADDLILECLQDLFGGSHHPTTVLAMKDLYELLEKIVDRCRDGGNVVTHIILKYS